MDFPAYRKYTNDRSFFKILSDTRFEELKITGKYYSLEQLETRTLPERNLLHDMLHEYDAHWEIIPAALYEEKKQYCLLNLTKINI